MFPHTHTHLPLFLRTCADCVLTQWPSLNQSVVVWSLLCCRTSDTHTFNRKSCVCVCVVKQLILNMRCVRSHWGRGGGVTMSTDIRYTTRGCHQLQLQAASRWRLSSQQQQMLVRRVQTAADTPLLCNVRLNGATQSRGAGGGQLVRPSITGQNRPAPSREGAPSIPTPKPSAATGGRSTGF